MEDQLAFKAMTNLNWLLPESNLNTIDNVVNQLIVRSNAITMRQAARSLKASVRTTKFTKGTLQALCIPIKSGPKAERGFKYSIVVDPSRTTHNEDADPWAFLVGHEIAHIVSNTFGSIASISKDNYIEDWCSDFGRTIALRLGPSRR